VQKNPSRSPFIGFSSPTSRDSSGISLPGALSFAKTLQGHKSRPVTMLQARPHAIHFKRILDFGEGQPSLADDWPQEKPIEPMKVED
jgi:hypothetical protein